MVPVAIHTAWGERIAARNRFAVQRLGIKFLFARVARAALYLGRFIVGKILSFQVGVTAGASETGVYGSGKFLSVHVKRDGLAGSGRGHAFVAVARETFRSGLVVFAAGGAYGSLRKSNGENRGENDCNDYAQTPLSLYDFCFSHSQLST